MGIRGRVSTTCNRKLHLAPPKLTGAGIGVGIGEDVGFSRFVEERERQETIMG